jgi:aryl sulfotransferase
MAARPPLRQVRTRVFDSTRWQDYQPRPDDIIIATYSKCGTTWMQRIVSMLIFGTAEPKPIWELSPWPDMCLFGPIEATLARAEAQTHRRFFKSHMPYDALPVHDGVKFIHVGRDGRDAALSLHNHLCNFGPETYAQLDEMNRADEKFGNPYPRPPADPADYFHEWVSDETYDSQGDPAASFFHVENSYWAARDDPNILLVHYADLKRDREAEMRRVAKFLDIEIADSLWPELVDAAGFEAMKRQGDALIPEANHLWGEDGSKRFFNKGKNGRWKDVVRVADLDRYDAKVREAFSPELGDWIENGRSSPDTRDHQPRPAQPSMPTADAHSGLR